MQQQSKHCKFCGKNVLAKRKEPNHILHLLLSIFTGGLWLPIWALVSINSGEWRCSSCGSKV